PGNDPPPRARPRRQRLCHQAARPRRADPRGRGAGRRLTSRKADVASRLAAPLLPADAVHGTVTVLLHCPLIPHREGCLEGESLVQSALTERDIRPAANAMPMLSRKSSGIMTG